MAKVIIADDHVVLREGLRALLRSIPEIEVVGEAGDGTEVMPLVEQLRPDILLLDLSMPNLGGIETLGRLREMSNPPTVLIVSAKDDEYSVAEALHAGARGFIPKSSSKEEICFGLRSLMKGQLYVSPSVCAGLFQHGIRPGEAARSPLHSLSPRELEVMRLICEGMKNKDIARTLHISTRTIDTHRTNIIKKLGVKSNAELVQLAIKCSLISP